MTRFRGPIAFLDRNTSDRRRIASLHWRDLPLPVVFAEAYGMQLVGTLTEVEIVDGAVMATVESEGLALGRHPVGVNLDSAAVVLADVDGVPLAEGADLDGAIELFVDGRLMGLTVYRSEVAAFPDALIESV